jgi:hypothetical protein
MSRFYGSGFEGSTSERGAVIASSGRSLQPFEPGASPPSIHGPGFGGPTDVPPPFITPPIPRLPVGPGGSSTDVRSPTSTRTEVRSPTSTRTEVRSPTSTSTEAYTRGNFTSTVTGGAGSGDTIVNIYATPGDIPPAEGSRWGTGWG